MFPIVEGSEDKPHMRNETRSLLRWYIKRDLYISEKHYLVSSKPDRKNKRVGRCGEQQ